MFDWVEKHKRILQIFLGLIGITFATWGIESYTRFRGGEGTLAKVNGLEISQREFDEQNRQQQERMRQVLGRNVDPAALDTPESRKAILDSMIAQRVIASNVAKANLTVTDEMLRETIAAIPAFQAGGQFSKSAYETMLRAQNPPMTPAQFEARLRYDIAMQQLAGAVGGTAIPSRTVTSRLAALESQKREIAVARISAKDHLASVKVDDAKLKAHYDANQADFRVPERVKAEYVVLSADALARDEPVTEDELKKAYEARAGQFKVDEQRRASHILVKTREEADKLFSEVKKNPARFAELARKHSIDPGSAEKGGDLGTFARGMMVKAFEDQAFAMKEGEISQPVQTEFGFHIIRITGIQPGKARTLEEVKKELTAELAKQKGQRKFAEAAAEQFSNLVYEQADSLKPAADRFKLRVQATDWVAKSAKQELGALDNPKLLSALFSVDSIKTRRNTDAVEVAQGTLVAARVVDYQPAAQRKFEEVKAEIAELLRSREAQAAAQKEGEAKLAALRDGKDAGVQWEGTRSVSRREPQGVPPDVLRVIVSADVSKLPAYVGMPIPDSGYALVRISKVTDADPKEAGPESEQRLAQLFGAAQYEAYVASLRSRADIELKKEKDSPEKEKK
jgi:peptidyl-prolyl cis-trans isomerase D